MPTGVHLEDARVRLFDAAEVVLLREGPGGLTSRAITDEACCAKGVLHRYFADVDTFLVELVVDRAGRLRQHYSELHASAGTDSVVNNLTSALQAVFTPITIALLPLITFRDALRTRLHQRLPGGVPILGEATEGVAAYLTLEKDHGRIHHDADVDTLALALIGGVHLGLAGQRSAVRGDEVVADVVRSVVGAPAGS